MTTWLLECWSARPFLRTLAAGGAALWIGLLSTGTGMAHVDGPPPATAGGFGDDTCHTCHFDSDLNDSAGSLILEGIPEDYVPGVEYLIEILLARPEIARGGFEAAARFQGGPNAGRQAGSLESIDERVEVVTAEGRTVQYARQTEAGSLVESDGTARWSLRWTAPQDSAGPIVLNVAANASNYDDSAFGDFIYTRETLSRGPGLLRRH